MTNYQERLTSLESLKQKKIEQLSQLEQTRVSLSNEIVEINGKIKLLNEMIAEEKNRESNKEYGDKQQNPNGEKDDKNGDDTGGHLQRHRGNQG